PQARPLAQGACPGREAETRRLRGGGAPAGGQPAVAAAHSAGAKLPFQQLAPGAVRPGCYRAHRLRGRGVAGRFARTVCRRPRGPAAGAAQRGGPRAMRLRTPARPPGLVRRASGNWYVFAGALVLLGAGVAAWWWLRP